ncbi:MAG TPA: MerR family transcriptional regulator [Ktedonobacteraceae bacterium]|jgi:DNA-binding transcriptional MerR regulator|nr:MerR family transcriptional regulator [Ktedonobacteraceae bacterium]
MASHVYTTAEVVSATGFSQKQLDYWASTGLLVPGVQQSHGAGTRRLYSVDDLVQLQFIRHLKNYGWSTRKIGQAVRTLREVMNVSDPLKYAILVNGKNMLIALCKTKDLVSEYIINGIVRFLDANWKYAQAVNDAGILGYVLYGEVAQIVEAINQEMLAIPQRPESSTKDVRRLQALQAARKLSSSDQLKLCNPAPVNNFIFYESHHCRHFCNQDIRLYHFFLTLLHNRRDRYQAFLHT